MTNGSPLSSLLIIGGTKAGKTHYGGQLLRRLETKKYPLRIVGAPSDLTPFQEVLDRLAQGRSAPHTSTLFYRESIWQVQRPDDETHSELVWPDYGGEQIEDIVKKRQASEPWVQRIRASSGWLFFVRLSTTTVPEDILDRPRRLDRMKSGSDAEGSDQEPVKEATASETAQAPQLPKLRLSHQAGLVELLQALLFIKQAGSVNQLREPPLVVVLSCWDEIANSGSAKPADILKSRLPLLSQFIEATWRPGRAEIMGLSALGKALKDDVSDEAFMDNGPERQGWCIAHEGEQLDDLTLPVTALMDKTGSGR
jgi:Double-GTPase 1